MNKKAEGEGGIIILVLFIAILVWGPSDAGDIQNYEPIFQGCENFCINNSQEYYGVDNFKESHRTCVCSNETYPIYRKGLVKMEILDNTGYPTLNTKENQNGMDKK